MGTFFEKYIHRCIPSKLVSDVNLQREDSRVHPCLAAKSWTHCNHEGDENDDDDK